MEFHGVLPIGKPKGMTSHAVVSTLRKLTKFRKIGHAGTLDPDARGLLILCLGKATKISNYLMEGRKAYRVSFRFGVETNTYDSTGKVLAEKKVDVDEKDLLEASKKFLGEITQLAPPFSAVKVKGQKLYQYARKGEEVERPSRKIHVDKLELLNFSQSEGEFLVECSKGTYVRSLIHDLGQALGCGAVTTEIVRTRSGQFLLEEALPLENLLEVDDPSATVRDHLVSISNAMPSFPKLQLDARSRQRVVHGNALTERELVYCKWGKAVEGPQDTVVLVDEEREALALGNYDGHATVKVSRVF